MAIERVSSNTTLFFKIGFPTAWIVFFGVFTIAILLSDPEDLALLSYPLFKYGFLFFYLFFFFLLYISFMKLKRVEFSEDKIYISNYFKTYSYTYDSVEKISETDLLFFKLIRITLYKKGKLGKKIPFIASKARYPAFINRHPELFKHLL